MKYFCLSLALVCSVTFASLTSFAQTISSSKATAAINTAVGCTVTGTSNIGDTVPVSCHDLFYGTAVDVTADNFATIMSSSIKVSNSQSLFVSPSLVTGLYTQTKTKTSTGTTSTAVAEGGVFLRAVVTNLATGAVQVGFPVAACSSGILGCQSVGADYGVVLDTRVQSLTQSISNCIVTVGTTTGTCSFDVTTDLLLKTTSAHTFNFIFPNVGVGSYRIDVQAAVNADASLVGSGTAVGGAAYGLGSLTVESVRMVHDFSF